MKHRKLRIAWSVVWALAAVLLIVLWVRSYWRWDAIAFQMPKTNGVSIKSFRGKVVIRNTDLPLGQPWPSGIDTLKADDQRVIVFEFYQARNLAGPLALRYNGITANVYYWTLVVLFAVIACIPWLPWWSHRFSLRTLLIATTLVAVVLGLVVYAARK